MIRRLFSGKAFHHAATFWVAAFAIGATGCAHTLGAPPTDAQLENDGSEQARSYLYEKYRLKAESTGVSRPFASEFFVEGDDPELDSYVAQSDEAVASLATLPVALSRWTGSVAMPITLIASGASIGAGIGLFAGLMALEPGGVLASGLGSGVGLSAGRSAVRTTLLGAGAGALAAVPISLMAWWTVDAVVRHVAYEDVREAVDAYNSDLKQRIEKGYQAELVRPPPAEATRDDVEVPASRAPSSQPTEQDSGSPSVSSSSNPASSDQAEEAKPGGEGQGPERPGGA